MDILERLKQAITLLMKEFYDKNGVDAKIEDGEETVGIFNDGVLTVGCENGAIKVNAWLGQPLKINFCLIKPELEAK